MTLIKKSQLKNHLSSRSLKGRLGTDPIVQKNGVEIPVTPAEPQKAPTEMPPLTPPSSVLHSPSVLNHFQKPVDA
jgi:hypothetical protein